MKLKKELHLLDVFSITSGTMMSAGLFILPGLAYAKAGPAVLISYLLAGLLAIPGMLSQAELSSAMPKAGGSYYFITRSMGPMVGTIYGLITWFALTFKSAFALMGITIFAEMLIHFNEYAIASSLCIVFIIINIIGIKVAGRVQIVLVLSIFIALIIYIIFGITEIEIHNYAQFSPKGFTAVIATAGYVFISYGGLLKVASVGEEVKDPGRVLPLGMILSLVIVGLFYMFVIFITIGVMDGEQLNNSVTPISDGASVFMGAWGKIVLSIIAIVAFTSASNAGIMAASRYPMALGRDNLLPVWIGKINKRFNTPHIATVVTGIIILGALLLKLDILVKAASSVVICTYLFSCLSVIILRESKLQNYQPSFRSPLYPWIQIVGAIGFGFILYEIGKEALIITLILIVVGLVIYLMYGRAKSKKEYALMHLIERITAKELTSHSLETELKEVIRERDDIIKDRFDSIIENCQILDIDKPMPVKKFFEKASAELSKSLKIGPEELCKMLMDREKQSSTVLLQGMAIPHVVIEGEKDFDILIARCREGIKFPDDEHGVKAVFFLVGTRDERNFHLRALSAIAQIVQDIDFEKKWLNARGIDALRDIVLLGKRRR